MASGHVNRANRPNTWLHRPRLQREDSPCQLAAVHTWHKANMLFAFRNVCYWEQRGHLRCPLLTQSGRGAMSGQIDLAECLRESAVKWRSISSRDIAEAVISDTVRALSHAHRNAQRHATASAG